jgi:hypothetical protein
LPRNGDALHKHEANQLIQFGLATLVTFKQFCTKATPGARHRQVFQFTCRGDQVAFIMPVAIIAALGRSLVKCGLDEPFHFLLEDGDQGMANGETHPFLE